MDKTENKQTKPELENHIKKLCLKKGDILVVDSSIDIRTLTNIKLDFPVPIMVVNDIDNIQKEERRVY